MTITVKVSYADEQDCDEEYEVCWDDDPENSLLFDTESAARDIIHKMELAQDGTVYYLYLLTTYYDAFGDRGLTESKLLYRTGEEIDE